MEAPRNVTHKVILSVGIASLALAILVQASPMATAAGTTPGPLDVRVTNTPLAVTGVMTAAGGTVEATQSGAWNVGVSGTANVQGTVTATQGGTWNVGIAGTPTVQAPATQIVRVSARPFDSWLNNTGRVAVLESVSCSSLEQPAGGFFVGDAGGEAAIYYIFPLDSIGGEYYESHLLTRIYVQPGEYLGSWTGCWFNGHTEAFGGLVSNQ